MRIISDFKDYYDSAQAFGSEPGIVYLRRQVRYESPWCQPWQTAKLGWPSQTKSLLQEAFRLLNSLPHRLVWHGARYDDYLQLEIPLTVRLIGFCGFLYPFLSIDQDVFASTDDLENRIEARLLQQYGSSPKEVRECLNVQERWSRRGSLTHHGWKKAVQVFATRRFDEVFIGLGVPVFKVESSFKNQNSRKTDLFMYCCALNPSLRLHSFQRTKSPTQAFQEISMYLGNQLARQNDPPAEISDEIMRDEKGFDEWSFRRHKEEDPKYLKKHASDSGIQ